MRVLAKSRRLPRRRTYIGRYTAGLMRPLLVALMALITHATSAPHRPEYTRRAALRRMIAATSVAAWSPYHPASALDAIAERDSLVAAIESDAADDVVLRAIEALVPLDPSSGRAATSQSLTGTWDLLWSYKADKFSPLLGLPRAVRPRSLQLLGDAATPIAGQGRVANQLYFPFGAHLTLSSGVQPVEGDPSVLEIFPPFRLDVDAAGATRRLVDAGSDADFRALNARTSDEQAAPRNKYAQLYLETSGEAGDLRISKVVSGDPVIVGSMFVHRRL